MADKREQTLNLLESFLNQSPNLDTANYGGDIAAYRQDYNEHCRRPLEDGRKLLAAVRWRRGISGEDLIAASNRAFSGRLELTADSIHYTPGQFGDTEYRHAVCAVLAAALIDYYRGEFQPAHDGGIPFMERVRKKLRPEIGRGTVNRYFR